MVGYGRLSAVQLVNWLVSPGAEPAKGKDHGVSKTTPAQNPLQAVKVMGGADVLMQLSKCCAPVPGDPILGYITRGRGLTVHAKGCPKLETMDYEKDRLVEIEWDPTIEEKHSVKVCVLTIDRPGVLANVSSAISASKANISQAEISTGEDQKAVLDFRIEISNTHHLDRTLEAIGRVDGVISAKRVRSWEKA